MHTFSGVDDYGLPLGAAREGTMEKLCQQIIAATGKPGSYVHYISTKMSKDSENVGITATSEYVSPTITFVVNDKIQEVTGSEVESLWGEVANPNVSIIALHRNPKDDSEPILVLLCTKLGDTFRFEKYSDGRVRVVNHGEALSDDTDTVINILRRILGLPVDTCTIAPRAVLASWLTRMCLKVAQEYEDNTTASVFENINATILLATVSIVLKNTTPSKQKDELESTLEKIKNNVKEDQYPYIEDTGSIVLSAQNLGDSLLWADLPSTVFAELLPPELQSEPLMRWAGDGMASWWLFDHYPQSPDNFLAQLGKIDKSSENAVRNWLEQINWWPAEVAIQDVL